MAENFNYLAFVLLLISSSLLLFKLWLEQTWLQNAALGLIFTSAIVLGIVIWIRTSAAGHLPFNNIYGFLLCFIWMVLLLYLVLAIYYKMPEPGAFIIPITTLLLGVTFFLSPEIKPLMPALRSNWLFLHVLTSVISYGAFALSFGLSLYYIVKIPITAEQADSKNILLKERLETVIYNSVVLGFVFLTLLIITGAIWAEQAWGAWWSWDPKESWALVTWLIYAIYLHLRRRKAWRGHRGCYLNIAGFFCVIFTFFGVSYLLSGLHSYM